MMVLAAIGFGALVLLALLVTLITVQIVFGSTLGFSAGHPVVLCLPAAVLWLLVWWLNPFTVSIGVAA